MDERMEILITEAQKNGVDIPHNWRLHKTVMDAMQIYSETQVNKFSVNPSVSKSLTQYRCPICGGNGLVGGSFYTALLGCVGTSANITEQCRNCKGAGIIYG